jgi:heme-degrading monooxygenase HmoA
VATLHHHKIEHDEDERDSLHLQGTSSRRERVMHARASFYQLPPGADADAAVSGFDQSVDAVQQLDGNQGLMLLIDRDSGKAISLTLWDSEDSLRSSSEQANTLRERAASAGGLTIQGVEHYEVVRDVRR